MQTVHIDPISIIKEYTIRLVDDLGVLFFFFNASKCAGNLPNVFICYGGHLGGHFAPTRARFTAENPNGGRF